MMPSKNAPNLSDVMSFLRSIGLEVFVVPGSTSFVPGVRVSHGTLEVDPDCLISNLLHEAGHVAITPARYRALMDGNFMTGMRTMVEDAMGNFLDIDSPLYRAVIQCSDPEATAWAWAAGMKIGVPREVIILDDQYEGAGASIRQMLSICQYTGIHGLANAGLCRIRDHSCKEGEQPYPALLKWTQDADKEAEADQLCLLSSM